MLKSETIGELAKALVKAQHAMDKAKKGSINPFFKSKYADLASVWEACKDHLADNGLSIVQTNDIIGNNETALEGVVVETTLRHTSGEWISGRLAMKPTKADPQGIGSAITYARRYALAAMVGVCPEDDDAEGAVDRTKKDKYDVPLTGTRVDPLPPCPECDETSSVIEGKAEWGGGYVCYKKKGGCGCKFQATILSEKDAVDAEVVNKDTGEVRDYIKEFKEAQNVAVLDLIFDDFLATKPKGPLKVSMQRIRDTRANDLKEE